MVIKMLVENYHDNDLQSLIRNELFQIIIDELQIGFAIIDTNGIYKYINKSYASIHGLENKEKYIGKKVDDFFTSAKNGTLKAIKTQKKVITKSKSINGVEGLSFRYPIVSKDNRFICCITETLATNLSSKKLIEFIDTIKSLQKK